MTAQIGGPSGLGGWLILPAIGLILSPVRLLISLNTDLLPIFQEGYWEILTTPGSEAYHPLWAPFILFEVFGNLFFIIFSIALIAMFFLKSHWFPKLMITYLLSNLFFVVGDYFLADLIPVIGEETDFEALGEIVKISVGVVIWVPYFLVSKRVRNTFVKPGADRVAVEVFS